MIYKEKIEELLIKNWTNILDAKKIIAAVLRDAAAASDTFNIVTEGEKPERNMLRVGVSRFEVTTRGFLLWAEFAVPRPNGSQVGTAEYLLGLDGTLRLLDVRGTRPK